MCSSFDVCWSFGVAGLGWYPCSRLKPATRIPPQLRAFCKSAPLEVSIQFNDFHETWCKQIQICFKKFSSYKFILLSGGIICLEFQ